MSGNSSEVDAYQEIEFTDVAPIVRIFDVAKAHEFYIGFLSFKIDWEHRFHQRAPLYTQVSRGALKLHLSEHSGDATPGSNMCVYMTGIAQLHKELMRKDYPYMRPGLAEEDGRLELTVIDPFGNRIRFMQLLSR